MIAKAIPNRRRRPFGGKSTNDRRTEEPSFEVVCATRAHMCAAPHRDVTGRRINCQEPGRKLELRAERSLVLARAGLVGDPGCASGDHGLEGSVRPFMR